MMRVRTSFCGPISQIGSRTGDEHEEHEECGKNEDEHECTKTKGNRKNSKDGRDPGNNPLRESPVTQDPR